ncbi:hypothetical protein SAMD00019534_092850 [Acytostelium subglobosum LB1]|uniref:hypothetical protein n=1 Tax=Acytostelium subglobosum LB1 TaxID=1410327 RepID=UPI0006450168|nr:hypothetical protein SAMD00019534_092850 [Acytostelium subglobosum LB1]GAM26110.1 hypothetical protein SAMD00019534_092850 [Acytostelium subglobosum LB1]|eukprot:XP_012751153.1 hypothetical protein SAMD00019534_092850 [Acytostelium subglobosum LB1]
MTAEQVNIEKSPNDKNDYRYIQLENGMRAILVHDPTAEQAAAALSVSVGSLSNPDDYLGLAHFLEHMLFLGTERFPIEKEFVQFISMNGGSYNAYTDMWHTNYFFNVNQRSFDAALDRFSSFFVSPLFSESATMREINAVDSEYHANLQSDPHHQHYATTMCFSDHPLSRFGCGSLETLNNRPGLRDRMIAFYNQYYSANIMSLCLLGAESLDELEALARKYFADIVNKNIQAPRTPALSLSQTVKLLGVPVNDVNILKVSWPVPGHLSSSRVYQQDPWSMASHILGHESTGSLFAHLKALGYAHALMSGPDVHDVDTDSFYVRIELTELGLAHQTEVMGHLYNYIQMMIHSELPIHLYKEKEFIQEFGWNNLSKVHPIQYVLAITHNMGLITNHSHVLKMSHMCQPFNPTLFKEAVSCLSFDNMVVQLFSKSLEEHTDSVHQYYSFKYSKRAVPTEELASWKTVPKTDKLHFPRENLFIPTDFTIKAKQTREVVPPEAVYNKNNVSVEWAPDHLFNTPKASIVGRLQSSRTVTARDFAQVYLFKMSIKSILNDEVLYNAHLCGLSLKMIIAISGITIATSGYNDKLATFVLQVFKHLNNFDISQELFDLTMEYALQKLANAAFAKPIEFGLDRMRPFSTSNKFAIEEELIALQTVTREEFVQFVRSYIQSLNVHWLIVGNISKEEAIQFGESISKEMSSSVGSRECDVQHPRRVAYTPGVEYHLRMRYQDPNQMNSVVIACYQFGELEVRKASLALLLKTIMGKASFNELRTIQQLGYIVQTVSDCTMQTVQLRLMVQSNSRDADYVYERINEFVVNQFTQQLRELSQEDFDAYVKSIQELLEQKKSNNDELTMMFEDLSSNYGGDYKFRSKQVAELSKITKDDLIEFHSKYLASASDRRLFVVEMFGNGHEMKELDTKANPRIRVVDNSNVFKQSMSLYPTRALL